MRRTLRIRLLGLTFAVTIVIALALPTLRSIQLNAPDGTLYGYTDEVPPRPNNLARAFFDRSFQRWVGSYFDVSMGFRAALVRSFNEINFRVFREAPKLRLYSTSAHGLYSKMSIDSLNDEVTRRDTLSRQYGAEAQKLLRVQRLLRSEGKDFQVVIATSKPYVFPDDLGARYLSGGSRDIFGRAASLGNALRSAGVNVIDSGPLLRQYSAEGIQTHPYSGVHWNYYAGCLIARKMLDEVAARKIVHPYTLDCGSAVPSNPYMVDVDGLDLLNIWSTGDLAKTSIYPSVSTIAAAGSRPAAMVFISDSFSDQIRYSLQQAHVYSRLVNSGYFRVRELDDPTTGVRTAPNFNANVSTVRQALLQDIARSDMVVLEMVDYNVQRWDYDFANYLLEYASHGGGVDVVDVEGTYEREVDGANWWNWVQHKATYRLQPVLVPASEKQSVLHFEYLTRGDQNLEIKISAADGATQQFQIHAKNLSTAKFETVVNLPRNQLSQVTVETNGNATILGHGDSRTAAFLVRNLTFGPSHSST